jgi:hypothetical protein
MVGVGTGVFVAVGELVGAGTMAAELQAVINNKREKHNIFFMSYSPFC